MPINQAQIEMLVCVANPLNMSGRKTWVLDSGNFQTACHWFKKITGQEFNILAKVKTSPEFDPSGQLRKSGDGFLFMTVNDDELNVSVTLRGGSSTTLDGAWVAPQNTMEKSPAYQSPAFRYADYEGKDLTKVPITKGSKDLTWGDLLTGQKNPHTSVPTIEIQNAEKLKDVHSFTPFLGGAKVIAEIKFTTRAVQSTVKIK